MALSQAPRKKLHRPGFTALTRSLYVLQWTATPKTANSTRLACSNDCAQNPAHSKAIPGSCITAWTSCCASWRTRTCATSPTWRTGSHYGTGTRNTLAGRSPLLATSPSPKRPLTRRLSNGRLSGSHCATASGSSASIRADDKNEKLRRGKGSFPNSYLGSRGAMIGGIGERPPRVYDALHPKSFTDSSEKKLPLRLSERRAKKSAKNFGGIKKLLNSDALGKIRTPDPQVRNPALWEFNFRESCSSARAHRVWLLFDRHGG
jgi:hypothetical protein